MKTRTSLILCALAVLGLVAVQPAKGLTIYWDGTSASWNTAANWSTASGATTPDPAAVPGSADDAIFNITTVNGVETITLDANQAAKSLTFNNTGLTTLTGGGTARTLTLGTGGITIGASAGAVALGNGTAGNNVLLALASGNQAWTNNSATNALTINNTAASFTRSAGATLAFNQASTGLFSMSTTVLPNSNGIIGTWASFGTGASTQYAYNNAGTIAGLTGTAAATAANLIDNTGTANYDLAVATGTVPAIMSANTIRYTGVAATTAPGATAFKVNGLMNAGTGLWTIGTSTLTIGASRELVVNAANNDITISSIIANNGVVPIASSLTKTGSGTLTLLTATSTYTGGTTVNAGTLKGTGVTNQGFGSTSGALTVNAGTVDLNIGAGTFLVGNLTGSGGTIANNTAGAGILSIGNGNGTGGNFAGVIADNTGSGGTLSLLKTGTGTITLSGANTFSGSIWVREGILRSGTTNLINGRNVTIGAESTYSTLDLNGYSDTIGNITYNANHDSGGGEVADDNPGWRNAHPGQQYQLH